MRASNTLALASAAFLAAHTANAAGKHVAIVTPFLSSVATHEMVADIQADPKAAGRTVTVIDTKGDMAAFATASPTKCRRTRTSSCWSASTRRSAGFGGRRRQSQHPSLRRRWRNRARRGAECHLRQFCDGQGVAPHETPSVCHALP